MNGSNYSTWKAFEQSWRCAQDARQLESAMAVHGGASWWWRMIRVVQSSTTTEYYFAVCFCLCLCTKQEGGWSTARTVYLLVLYLNAPLEAANDSVHTPLDECYLPPQHHPNSSKT